MLTLSPSVLSNEPVLHGSFALDAGSDEESRDLVLSFTQRPPHQSAHRPSTSSSSSSSESVAGSETGVEQHRSQIRILLPASARMGQTGSFTVEHCPVRANAGPLTQIKLELSEREKQLALSVSRSGYSDDDDDAGNEFPLSAGYLAEKRPRGLACAVCRDVDVAVPFSFASSGSKDTASTRFRALPSQGWEELVDAWMCHTDQHLNRTLTETAVRFTHRMAGTNPNEDEQQPEELQASKEANKTLWIGDTYLLVPPASLASSAVTIEQLQHPHSSNATQVSENPAKTIVVRCRTCQTVLNEPSMSSTPDSANSGPPVKMSKYVLVPVFVPQAASQAGDDQWIWAKVLLTALAHASGSTGTRKFLLRPQLTDETSEPEQEQGVVVWLFTVRTAFTASCPSLAAMPSSVRTKNVVWKGSKLLFRPSTQHDDSDGQIESMPLPPFVFSAVVRMLAATNNALHPSTRVPFPTTVPQSEVWQSAFLVTPHPTSSR